MRFLSFCAGALRVSLGASQSWGQAITERSNKAEQVVSTGAMSLANAYSSLLRAMPFLDKPEEEKVSAFAPDRVGYAVGDVHGRADLLALMFDRLESQQEADVRPGGPPLLMFLGDYIDRGPNTPGVIDLLISDRPSGFERRYLKGNHEQSLLAFLTDPLANRAWVVHGGAETMRSYGVAPPPAVGADDQVWIEAAAALSAALPEAHRSFLEGLERYVTVGDYMFVHAGVDVAKPLEEQTDQDLFWSRQKFLNARRRFPYRVVHGHTPVDKPFSSARRVGIDTGAYASGALTAARFEGEDVQFLTITAAGRAPV
jgi:serine/threonine protein phosphatase 1